MTSSALFRWAGLATMLSGLFVIAGRLLHPPSAAANVNSGAWVMAHLLLLGSLLLGIQGVFGLYWRQSRNAGTIGFIGFLMAFVAMALFTGLVFFEAFINPPLAAEAPAFVEKLFSAAPPGSLGPILLLTGLLFSLGWLLLGIATVRAGILPRTGAIIATVGAIPFGIEPLFPDAIGKIAAVVFSVGIIWLGSALWQEREIAS